MKQNLRLEGLNQIVKRVAERFAMEHASPEALETYLKQHPKADRSKHLVKEKGVGKRGPGDSRHYESMAESQKRPDFRDARSHANTAFSKSETAKKSGSPADHREAMKAHEEAAKKLEAAGAPDQADEHRAHAKRHEEVVKK